MEAYFVFRNIGILNIICKIVWFTPNKFHSKLVKTTKPDLHGTLGLLAIAELFCGIFSRLSLKRKFFSFLKLLRMR